MDPSIQEEPKEVVENVGSDLFSNIAGDLLPGSEERDAKRVAESNEDSEGEDSTPDFANSNSDESGVDISDLMPDEAPAEKEEKEEEAKPAASPEEKKEGLSPEDVADASALAGDDMPDDLLKEEDTDKVFKKDIKAKDAFLKERAYNKSLREQLKQAQSELMAAKSDSVDPAEVSKFKEEIESYKEKVEKLEADIGQLDLTKSPAFREQYDDKINQIGTKMAKLLTQEGLDQAEAVQFVRQVIAEQRPSAREQLINDMAPGLSGTLAALGLQADEVVQARAAALENWKETSAALEETNIRKQTAQLSEKVEEYTQSALEEAKKLGNPYYMDGKTEEWNAQVQKRKEALKGILLSGDMGKVASLVAEGLTAADLRGRYAKLLKDKREVDAELASVLKGSPNLSGRPSTKGVDSNPPPTGNREKESHAVPLEDAITNDLLPPKP